MSERFDAVVLGAGPAGEVAIGVLIGILISICVHMARR